MSVPWMSPSVLAPIEETRIARAVASVAREHLAVAGGTVCWGGPGSWMNEGRGLGVTVQPSASDVDRAIAFLRDRGAPARFDVCPHAHPSLLGLLSERGLRALGHENVLYRALGDVTPPALPAGLEIVSVGDAERDVFARLVSGWLRNHENGSVAPPSSGESEDLRRVAEHPRTQAFLVRAESGWVGGGALEVWAPQPGVHPGIATLIMTAVSPLLRRRGVQTALMTHRLYRAQQLGVGVVTVGSDPHIATQRNALRLGFRVAYTKVILGEG